MIKNFGTIVKLGFHQLFNALEADTNNITENDIHHIAYINISFAKARGEFTMAIVAAKPYQLQLANLHKELSTVAGIKVNIFDNIGAAYKWLGFSPAQ